jgi:hypothetical protein
MRGVEGDRGGCEQGRLRERWLLQLWEDWSVMSRLRASMPIQLQEAGGMSAQNEWRNSPMGLEKMRSDSIPTAAARCFSSI